MSRQIAGVVIEWDTRVGSTLQIIFGSQIEGPQVIQGRLHIQTPLKRLPDWVTTQPTAREG